ncbi:hypothetical protein [Salinimicrobium sp. GXAS 041]|uniref:hypothetical protein n=1 Tax=Salinimicrobium sp. GXAS 041 TaxID=3400806 RepID=UPI003C70AB41
MKKLVLLLSCVFLLNSCEVDDDGPKFISYYSEVSEIDLPAYFEENEQYEIEVTYLLPTECHQPVGLEVSRGGSTGEDYRDIYVVGVSRMDASLGECGEEGTDVPATASFFITIDRDEPYTFYLWEGIDENDENIFTEIEVPVGEPEPSEGDTE